MSYALPKSHSIPTPSPCKFTITCTNYTKQNGEKFNSISLTLLQMAVPCGRLLHAVRRALLSLEHLTAARTSALLPPCNTPPPPLPLCLSQSSPLTAGPARRPLLPLALSQLTSFRVPVVLSLSPKFLSFLSYFYNHRQLTPPLANCLRQVAGQCGNFPFLVFLGIFLSLQKWDSV